MEQWKTVPGTAGKYAASSLGRIKSGQKILKGQISWKGYVRVDMYVRGRKRQRRFVHNLVGSAYGLRIEGRTCNHIDGDKQNNAITNLEWISQSANMRHAFETNLRPMRWGSNHLSRRDRDAIRSLRADGASILSISRAVERPYTSVQTFLRQEGA